MNKKRLHILALFVLLCAGSGLAYWLATPSLDKMVGQMIMTGFHGDGTGENAENFAAIENQVKSGHVGGVILFDVDISGLVAQGMTIPEAKKHIFSSNIKNMDQVANLTAHLQSLAPMPLLIAVDQEGGNIQRLKTEHGFAPIPSAKQLGMGEPDSTYRTVYDLGTRLANLGINVDFAPVVDVDVNPESPAIGGLERSFSADANVVTQHGDAYARGLNDAGVLASFKHFPGHGSAAGDTHAGMTDVTNTFQDYELTPYRELLGKASPCTMLMVAHVVNMNIDTLPASLSHKTIQMARDMGFNGVVVSDDMDMGAIVGQYGREKAIEMAINAGNDMLVFGNNLDFDANKGEEVHQTIVKLVHEGKIKRSQIRKSYNRIMKMKKCMGKQPKSK
ncbi:MAG: glycoside hydrolase family 3 protein [Alphaproteobacteria bacterium]|nr:glycoside hydrolase family 3 protein [Alphaproteobacteria bacterium]